MSENPSEFIIPGSEVILFCSISGIPHPISWQGLEQGSGSRTSSRAGVAAWSFLSMEIILGSSVLIVSIVKLGW